MATERFVLGEGATVVEVREARPEATVLEVTLAPGAGSGLHVHARESETIVVLAGTLEVGVAEAARTLAPGDAVHLPRGTPHVFANAAAEPVRALFVCVPGGLERFFRAVAAPAATAESVAAAAEAAGLRFG